MRRLPLQFTAAALAALSFLAPNAAHAAPLFDVGPAGLVAAATTAGEATGAQANTAVQAADLTVATVSESHLPAWLQVVVARAPLYAADSGNTVSAQLPRHTFLKVLGGGISRLQVQPYDENGNPAGQAGWVEADQVLPSAPATDWMVTSEATTLWSAADAGSATKLRGLDRFTPIQRVDDPTAGRVLVRVYSSDFSKMLDQGWVDASATGPALPPQMRVPFPDRTSALRTTSSTLQQQDFLDAAAQAARQAATSTGVPASVTVAQAILESDWGRSTLAQDANNYFGMKAMGTLGDDGVVWMPTSEYDDAGQLYKTTSAFRAYRSLADSMADHDRLLSGASRYASAMLDATDPRQFAEQIAVDGYSTDPAYADKLIALMDRYNLYSLDS